MTIEELTPEAIAIMKQLLNHAQPMQDSATLQLMFADRIIMGSPAKVHLTAMGGRMLAQARLKEQTH